MSNALKETQAFLESLGYQRTSVPSPKPLRPGQAEEVVYSRKTIYENRETIIRVYTGIMADGRSRPKSASGAPMDSLKICLARYDRDSRSIRVFKTLPLVKRWDNWQERFLDLVGATLAKQPVDERSLLEDKHGSSHDAGRDQERSRPALGLHGRGRERPRRR